MRNLKPFCMRPRRARRSYCVKPPETRNAQNTRLYELNDALILRRRTTPSR
jgi:hypothetical protein